MLYNVWDVLSVFFNYYFTIVPEVKHNTIYREAIKILTLKEMLQRLSIALAQVKAGNTSESLLNELCSNLD